MATRYESHPGGVYAKVVDGHRYWFARVYYRGDQYRFACDSEQEAREKASALRYEIKQAKYLGQPWVPPQERPTGARGKMPKLAEFADRFIEEWADTKSEQSRAFYKHRLDRIRERLGRKRLDRVTQADIQRYVNQRLKDTLGKTDKKHRKREEQGQVKTVSPTTVNHELKVLRIMFARAIEWGLIADNPAGKVKPVDAPEREDRYLFDEEAKRLFAACPDWVRPLVEVAANTGMRRGELLALRWSQVRLRERFIRLRGSETKSGKGRSVPLNARATEILSALPRDEVVDHVFTKDGHPVTPTMIRRAWPRVLKAAEVENFRFHDLRHTAASWMVMSGVALYEVQKILGHGSHKMVQRYAHLSPDYLRGAVEKLDGFTPPSEKTVTKTVTKFPDRS